MRKYRAQTALEAIFCVSVLLLLLIIIGIFFVNVNATAKLINEKGEKINECYRLANILSIINTSYYGSAELIINYNLSISGNRIIIDEIGCHFYGNANAILNKGKIMIKKGKVLVIANV